MPYQEYPCDRGTLSTASDQASSEDCTPCAAGSFCPWKATASDQVAYCAAGYYCEVGSWQEKPAIASELDDATYGPCEPGHYCPDYDPAERPGGEQATNPIACPAGTFSDQTLASTSDACEPCLEGRLCETDALTTWSDECPVGVYCESGTATEDDAEDCPTDTFCPLGSTWGMTCRTGYYQPASS